MLYQAAIISQVTVTSIQLGNVEQVHWIVRGCFYSSLVFSISAVFLSFLKHRDITSMNNLDMRSRLVFRPRRASRGSWNIDHPRTDPYRPAHLNMTVVLALYLPYALLNAAISTYFVSLLLYLVFSWKQLPNVNGSSSDSRNVRSSQLLDTQVPILTTAFPKIFILFVSSLIAGYFALIFVQRSCLHFVCSTVDRDDAEKLVDFYPDYFPSCGKAELSRMLGDPDRFRLEHFDGKRFMRLFEQIEHTYATTRQSAGEDKTLAGVATSSSSGSPELLKAITEAAEANKAAAAAIQAVAAQLERLSTGLVAPKTSSGKPRCFQVMRLVGCI